MGFRWQPYANQPKNSEADIERELGKVGSYASFWYMSLHTLPRKRTLITPIIHPLKPLLFGTQSNSVSRGHQNGTGYLASSVVDEWGENYEDLINTTQQSGSLRHGQKTVEWFGEDVDYYGIFHEANHPKYWEETG